MKVYGGVELRLHVFEARGQPPFPTALPAEGGGRLNRPQASSGRYGGKKIAGISPGNEHRFLSRTACSVIVTMKEVCQMVTRRSTTVTGPTGPKEVAFWLAFNITSGSLNYRPRIHCSLSSQVQQTLRIVKYSTASLRRRGYHMYHLLRSYEILRFTDRMFGFRVFLTTNCDYFIAPNYLAGICN
jgi:hypothetical protein